jgi:ComF family protein
MSCHGKIRKMSETVQRLFYPSCCLHCDAFIAEGGVLMCSTCAHVFEFLEKENSALIACFEYYGPVATFVKVLKSGKMPYLVKAASSFLYLRYTTLNWPKPDLIVPVPCRTWIRWNNHVHLMAKSLASMLNTNYAQPLKRYPGRPRQTELSAEERKTLSSSHFFIKNNLQIKQATILLIDDVVTTGSTLHSLTTLLIEGGAKCVLALVLAESGADISIKCTSSII